jgi:MATE family multidrug resistance protein
MTSAPDAAAVPQGGLLKRLILLAGPVAGSNVLVMLMGLVDTILVGRHSATELAELALAWSLNGTALVATIGLLVGVQVLAARRHGENQHRAIGLIWRRGIVTALVVGFLLAIILHFGALWALTHLGQQEALAKGAASCAAILGLSLLPNAIYLTCSKTLEALSRPRVALALMVGANVVNLLLGLKLVPMMGADGAAWATLGARVFLAFGATIWLLTMPDSAKFGFLDFSTKAQPGEAREQVSIGMAAAGSGVLEAGSFNILTIIAGIAGVVQVGAFTVVLNMMSIGFMLAMGIASATAVIVSNARGAGDLAGAKKVAWMGLGLSGVYATLFAIVTLVWATSIASAFTKDPAFLTYTAGLVGLVWLMAVPDFLQVVAAQALRALGRPWFPTFSHFVSYVLVMAPLGWFFCLYLGRGAQGLVEAIAVASVASAGILLIRLANIGAITSTEANPTPARPTQSN